MALETKGMIRGCHPPTPLVGLHRQCRDPERTRIYYEDARKTRDSLCFPRMLRQMTGRFAGYRLKRRLWIKAIRKILDRNYYVEYLTFHVMEYLSEVKKESIPIYFSFHSIPESDTLLAHVRMRQFAGKLASLGFPERTIPPVPDYEYENCMRLCRLIDRDNADQLYRTLQQRNVPHIWRIVFSHFPRNYTGEVIPLSISQWNHSLIASKIYICLKAFQKINKLTHEEEQYIYKWTDALKYPSV